MGKDNGGAKKVVIVVGASSDPGCHLCQHLASQKHTVIPVVMSHENRDVFMSAAGSCFSQKDVKVVNYAEDFHGMVQVVDGLDEIDAVIYTVETNLLPASQQLFVDYGMDKVQKEVKGWTHSIIQGFEWVFMGCACKNPVYVVVSSSLASMQAIEMGLGRPELWHLSGILAAAEKTLNERIEELQLSKGNGNGNGKKAIIHLFKAAMPLGVNLTLGLDGNIPAIKELLAKQVTEAMGTRETVRNEVIALGMLKSAFA